MHAIARSASEIRPGFDSGSTWLGGFLDIVVVKESVCRDILPLLGWVDRACGHIWAPLQGYNLIDKPCPRLWTTWSCMT